MRRGGGEINILFKIGRGTFISLGSLKRRRVRQSNIYRVRVLSSVNGRMRLSRRLRIRDSCKWKGEVVN